MPFFERPIRHIGKQARADTLQVPISISAAGLFLKSETRRSRCTDFGGLGLDLVYTPFRLLHTPLCSLFTCLTYTTVSKLGRVAAPASNTNSTTLNFNQYIEKSSGRCVGIFINQGSSMFGHHHRIVFEEGGGCMQCAFDGSAANFYAIVRLNVWFR